MLSDQSVVTVRATLPAVGASLAEITERFYAGMFAARPELLRDLFNRGNQAAGTQRQALAGSIAAFAAHLLDHPDQRPDAMLARIAHKHASLGVTAEQYALVHEHLFAAIAGVLGEAVTPEVAAAWDEVYWLMANALIAIETRLHEERGGSGWQEWEVVGRVEETADVATFRLRPADGRPAPDFRAGQYVSVQVELADGARQIRQYSLSAAPGSPVRQFSVKRVLDGGAAPDGEVSNHLHARVRVGDRLRLSAPYGDLVLAGTDSPLLLASAGIGVTPMVAMLGELADAGHEGPVTVVHGDRSPDGHAPTLRDTVRSPSARRVSRQGLPGGRHCSVGRASVNLSEQGWNPPACSGGRRSIRGVRARPQRSAQNHVAELRQPRAQVARG
jgi:nitric oxide dioxygenase